MVQAVIPRTFLGEEPEFIVGPKLTSPLRMWSLDTGYVFKYIAKRYGHNTERWITPTNVIGNRLMSPNRQYVLLLALDGDLQLLKGNFNNQGYPVNGTNQVVFNQKDWYKHVTLCWSVYQRDHTDPTWIGDFFNNYFLYFRDDGIFVSSDFTGASGDRLAIMVYPPGSSGAGAIEVRDDGKVYVYRGGQLVYYIDIDGTGYNYGAFALTNTPPPATTPPVTAPPTAPGTTPGTGTSPGTEAGAGPGTTPGTNPSSAHQDYWNYFQNVYNPANQAAAAQAAAAKAASEAVEAGIQTTKKELEEKQAAQSRQRNILILGAAAIGIYFLKSKRK